MKEKIALSKGNKIEFYIWVFGGAAELLNLPPSTLKSRMKKLGIRKEYNE